MAELMLKLRKCTNSLKFYTGAKNIGRISTVFEYPYDIINYSTLPNTMDIMDILKNNKSFMCNLNKKAVFFGFLNQYNPPRIKKGITKMNKQIIKSQTKLGVGKSFLTFSCILTSILSLGWDLQSRDKIEASKKIFNVSFLEYANPSILSWDLGGKNAIS